MNKKTVLITALVVLTVAIAFTGVRLASSRTLELENALDQSVLAGQPSLGKGTEVILIEDFLCPACKRFSAEVFPGLERLALDGSIKLYYLNAITRQESVGPALLAECVWKVKPENFWAVVKRFYAHDLLKTEPAPLTELSDDELATCGNLEEEVKRDTDVAASLGATTPSVIIGNTLYRSPTLEKVKRVIR